MVIECWGGKSRFEIIIMIMCGGISCVVLGGDLLLVRDNGESFGPVVVGPSDGVKV